MGCFSLVFRARACKYTHSVAFGRTIYFRLLSTCCGSGVKDRLVSVTLQDTVSQPIPDARPSVKLSLACQFAIWEISTFLSGP